MSVKLKGSSISDIILKKYPFFKKNYSIKVGISSGSTYPDGQSVADVAYWNEHGTHRIPARPTFAVVAFQNSDKWASYFAYIFKQSGFKVEPALEALGNYAMSLVKIEINNLTEPVLSPYTIKARKRRNSNATNKPLIDTGLLLNSVIYQVEKK